MPNTLPVLTNTDIDAFLERIDVAAVLEESFAALHRGQVVQPPQTLTLFPEDRGDCITYMGVLGHVDVFGAKLSPYIPTGGAPIVTAWTMLMSMKTGQPLLVCDSARLTRERTAATTALAVNKLARADSSVLAVIGSGSLALAHVRHSLGLRAWKEIRVFSPSLATAQDKHKAFSALDPRVRLCASAQECVTQADVVMLVTSAAKPVIDIAHIGKAALVTSVSTNAPKAHEIDPAQLAGMDVYCDYKRTTPDSAGEMQLAAQAGTWTKEQIRGDLADLCAGACPLPDYSRTVFFRSIGLGIEDVAIAYALYKQLH